MKSISVLAFLVGLAAADTLWDGRFNDLSSATDLEKWSFSDPVGPYQYYIHGTGNVTDYVNLSSDFKNPADTASKQGVKISLTDTAYWNGQTMRRTELIPQTNAAINTGKVFYHFSIQHTGVNAPALTREHQIAFFESHFTELKSGWLSGASGTQDVHLRWMISGNTEWSVEWEAGVWHNCAYEIDFSAGTVGFWHSTGSDVLTQVVAPKTVSASSNGADWHLGVLELSRDGYADANEDFYFSGVYIEDGEITTSVAGPKGETGSDAVSTESSVSAIKSTASVAPATTLQTSVATTTPTSEFPTITVTPTSAVITTSAAAPVESSTSIASGPTATSIATPTVLTSESAVTYVATPTTVTPSSTSSVSTPVTTTPSKCSSKKARKARKLRREARDVGRSRRFAPPQLDNRDIGQNRAHARDISHSRRVPPVRA